MKASAAATKQLRWQLLDMFPQAPMKLISEAAKCGDFDAAVDIITAATGGETKEQPAPVVGSPVPTAAVPEMPAQNIEISCDSDTKTQVPIPGSSDIAGTSAWLAGIDLAEGDKYFNVAFMNKDQGNSTHIEDILASDAKEKMVTDVRRTADDWEIRCAVDLERPCQSLRTISSQDAADTVIRHVGTDNTAAFAAVCFEQMLRREQDLEGEFCVFYHSYNSAALIYEVEAEIARWAFGLDEKFAPIPRIIQKHFTGVTIDDLRNSEGAQHQDCLPSFRRLAICASPTLFAFGSEAPPLNCFRHGYGIPAPLGQLTRDVICEAIGTRNVPKLDQCVSEMVSLAGKFGLLTNGYGSCKNQGPNRLGGQMLQIFIHRSEVDALVYNSLPFGVPIPTESVDRWLAGEDEKHRVDGQVRILMCPDAFLDESRSKIFHYCGDWQFLGGSPDMEGSRAAFVQALHEILLPVLTQVSPEAMRKNLTGETDCERNKRLQREKVSIEKTFRSTVESQRAAAKKATMETRSGYNVNSCPPAAKGNRKKGKKH